MGELITRSQYPELAKWLDIVETITESEYKMTIEIETVANVEKAIRALIDKGEAIADATGEHFTVGNEEYIPVSSGEWEDYEWIREENCLPHDQGFWYSSSMSSC